MMVRTRGERSILPQDSESPFESQQLVAHLHEQLQFYKDKAQKLEAEVQHLKEKLALRDGSSPRPPVSRQVSTQKPPSASNIVFRIEKPQLQQDSAITSDKPSELADLLKRVAKSDEIWCLRRKELRLSTIEEVFGTFVAFVFRARPAVTNGHVRDKSRPPTDADPLEDFKAFVRSLRRESERARQCYHFAELLFVSLCRVASKNGSSRETIDSLMDDFLPSTKKKKQTRQFTYLSHIRGSILWPIHQAELLRKKFKHRADEFFLLYGPTVTTYRRLHESKATQEFAEIAELPPPPDEGEFNSDISFAIPFMIKLIVGDRYDLDKVNKALGTNFSREEYDISLSALCGRIEQSKGIPYPPAKRRRTRLDDDQECAQNSIANHDTNPLNLHNAREYTPSVQASSSPTPLALGQHQILSSEVSWTRPEMAGMAVVPYVGRGRATAAFDPRASLLRMGNSSRVPGSESSSPLGPSPMQSPDYGEARLSFPHKDQEHPSQNQGSKSATSHSAGLREILEPGMQSPGSRSYIAHRDSTGQQGRPMPPDSSWTCSPDLTRTAVVPRAGPDDVTATFGPGPSLLETENSSHVPSESSISLAPSHWQLPNCHETRLGVPHQCRESLSPNTRPRSATSGNASIQQIIGSGMQSPGSWPYDIDRDTAGQQVARTLLGMRDPQPLRLPSPIPTEPPIIPLDYGGADPSRNQESHGLDTEAFSPVSMSAYINYQGNEQE